MTAFEVVDINAFSGNLMDFHYFMIVFNKIVEKKVDNSRGKLVRLIKYTTGDPKEMAKKSIQLIVKTQFKAVK